MFLYSCYSPGSGASLLIVPGADSRYVICASRSLARALSTQFGLPEGIRTPDLGIRSALLYPTELRTVTWCAHTDLNCEPTDYESGALTN